MAIIHLCFNFHLVFELQKCPNHEHFRKYLHSSLKLSHPKGKIFKNLPLGRVENSTKGKNLPSGGLKKKRWPESDGMCDWSFTKICASGLSSGLTAPAVHFPPFHLQRGRTRLGTYIARAPHGVGERSPLSTTQP